MRLTFAVFAALSGLYLTAPVATAATPEARSFEAGQAAYDSRDYARALDLWTSLAVQGDGRAQYGLGVMYANGRGVKTNMHQAITWYQKAADKRNAPAALKLAKLYAHGAKPDVAQDQAVAVNWYRRAADLGDTQAQMEMADRCDKGDGLPKDSAVATDWYRKAAEAGYVWAQMYLAGRYADGVGVAQDSAMAIAWYQNAAQSEPGILIWVANIYETGKGVPQDDAAAVDWYRKAAAGHDYYSFAARIALGDAYLSGQGVETNARTAATWYREAADLGDSDGEYNLGLLYLSGQGVVRDDAYGAKWLGKAASQEQAAAQLKLASLYEKGRGVRRDMVAAYMWYELAARSRYDETVAKDAGRERTRLANLMTKTQVAKAVAQAEAWEPNYHAKLPPPQIQPREY